ncbi:MAG: hypothetical protein RI932_1844 [Pseudomonadota bacterium]|jgi:hypothetical protein
MKRHLLPVVVFITAAMALSSCGTSLYRPISNKETADALREQTIMLLNSGDYEEAVSTAEKLWAKEVSNETASLYSIALASTAGIGLFDLTVSSIKTASTQTGTGSQTNSAGNSVFNSLSNALPDFTEEQLSRIKKSIDVLDAAPEKRAPGLVFQRCLTAGIYTVPTVKNLQQSITSVQTTLSALPSKLGSGSGSACSASSATINSAAEDVSASIKNLGTISGNFASAMNTMAECFPSAEGKDSLNTVSQQVSKLRTNADKGCAIPATQKIGSYTLPSCLNDTITNTGGATAVAGDGIIAGCELFLNCSSGSCL